MKILLTGGNGFLGRSFTEKYGSKYNITAPSSKEMNLARYEDINRQFKMNKFDAVLHFAAKKEKYIKSNIDTENLIFFKNIQYAAISNGVKKMLVAGDVADMGREKPLIDIDESRFGEVVPVDAYGLGRYLITLLASKDKISTVLRFFDIYGKNATFSGNKIMQLIESGIKGDKEIRLSKDKIISAVYIDDAVKIIDGFLQNDFPKGEYNIVADKKTSYLEIAKKIKAIAKKENRNVNIILESREIDKEQSGLNEKLKAVMPNIKFTSIGTGITKTIESFVENDF